MAKVKLKPCPFCGNTDIAISFLPPGIKAYCYNAKGGFLDKGCYVNGPTRLTEKEAIKAWNRRLK